MAEVRKGALGRRTACAEAWVKRVGYVEDLGLMLRVMGSCASYWSRGGVESDFQRFLLSVHGVSEDALTGEVWGAWGGRVHLGRE